MLTLPDFIPEDFPRSSSEEALIEEIKRDIRHLPVLLDFAGEDVRWFEAHQALLRTLLDWVSKKIHLKKLTYETAQALVNPVQKHHSLYASFLPKIMHLKVNSSDHLVNPILWFGASRVFYEEGDRLKLPISENVFMILQDWVEKNEENGLIRLSLEELLEMISFAETFSLQSLSDSAQRLIKRYMTSQNLAELLCIASKGKWSIVLQDLAEFIQKENLGVAIIPKSEGRWTFQFLDFRPKALRFFQKTKEVIKDVGVTGSLVQLPAFSQVIKQLPDLQGLDLHNTTAYDSRVLDTPPKITSLDLSLCDWLTNELLEELVGHFTELRSLSIAGCHQLSYMGFGALVHLPKLKKLDLSRIPIEDATLQVILRAAPRLEWISVKGCDRLSDRIKETFASLIFS